MDKRYDHTVSEPAAHKKWETEQIYSLSEGQRPLFSIDTPPPTVSGALHIGHIFSYTQTDIIARYKRMNGFRVFYPFGFDDNGLPTERYVEKKRKIRAHQLPRSEFIALCLEETKEAEALFTSIWQRMGLSADWRHTYSTISDEVRRISQESFVRLYAQGSVYRRDEPALYCVTCRTSVAQAELDDKELPSFFNDIAFKDEGGNDLLIGTTRPELLSSCVSLFYHPDDKRYHHLRGKNAIVPIFGNSVPILADEQVSPEKGTGLVMCCTFGDKADVEWYKKFKLPYRQSVGLDGKWAESTGILAGLKAQEARAKILEELKNQGLLRNQRAITHAVGVHERCGNEIEFVVLRQWFVHILKEKQKYIDLAEEINWRPAFMKARYIDWVRNIGWDWCISRQRFFGIPFPVWHCGDCGETLVARPEDLPIDPQESRYPGGVCTQCKSANIKPETDVMDTWNTSSVTPYICATLLGNEKPFTDERTKKFLPMGMRPQAHDIIRTWAFYTIVKSWMHHGRIPWHDVVISGHVLSDQKEKLSKSKENSAQAPLNLLQQYPADAIRYWTASGALGQDIAFSEAQLKIGLRLITKLWNAFLFTKEHIASLRDMTPPVQLGAVNEWLLTQAADCFKQYAHAFELYEFGAALHHVERFFWHDFCDNYLELIKNQLFNSQEYSQQEVEATRWTLYQIGLRILQFYAPYVPHVTETIYEQVYGVEKNGPSIHLTQFADVQQHHSFAQSKQVMELILVLINSVRKLKSENQLSLKVPIAVLNICSADAKVLEKIKSHEKLIAGVTQAVQIAYVAQGAVGNALKQVDDAWHATVELLTL